MSLADMKEMDVRDAKLEDLVDIRTVKIDDNLEKKDRIRQFVEQIKNPYLYKVGDTIVQVGYTEGCSMTERYKEMMLQKTM